MRNLCWTRGVITLTFALWAFHPTAKLQVIVKWHLTYPLQIKKYRDFFLKGQRISNQSFICRSLIKLLHFPRIEKKDSHVNCFKIFTHNSIIAINIQVKHLLTFRGQLSINFIYNTLNKQSSQLITQNSLSFQYNLLKIRTD
jgi:hypothetical protein